MYTMCMWNKQCEKKIPLSDTRNGKPILGLVRCAMKLKLILTRVNFGYSSFDTTY